MGKDLVFNLPGSIPRLPLHAGALKAWHDFGLPVPDTMICTSAGAMAASAFPSLSQEDFTRGIRALSELSPGQIFSFRSSLKFKAAALGLASVGLGLIMLFDDKISKTKKVTLGILGLGALLGTEGIVAKELLYSQSLFSIDPLIKLLNRELDFNRIFNTKIEIQILVSDMNQPGEIIFSNHDPKNSDPNNPEHRKRWLNILRATSRLPGKFPFIEIDGINTVDGEVWTDLPTRQMEQYKKVVRFDYWAPLQSEPSPRVWISDLTRSFDIMRDRCTQKKMDNYEWQRKLNPTLPEIFYLRLNSTLRDQMPQIKIHSFSPSDMSAMINIGYRAVKEEIPRIKDYLEI